MNVPLCVVEYPGHVVQNVQVFFESSLMHVLRSACVCMYVCMYVYI